MKPKGKGAGIMVSDLIDEHMSSWFSVMKNMSKQSWHIPPLGNTLEIFWNVEKVRRAVTGTVTSLWSRSSELLK